MLFYSLNQKAVISPNSIALWSKYQIPELIKTDCGTCAGQFVLRLPVT